MEAALTKRIDKLARGLDRLEWNLDLSNEAFALFVRFWLTSTAPLPDTALPAAQATGKKRWEGFVESLSRRMETGSKLADGVPARASPWCCISSRPPTTAIRRSHPCADRPREKIGPDDESSMMMTRRIL